MIKGNAQSVKVLNRVLFSIIISDFVLYFF